MAESSKKGQDGEIRVALDITTLDRSTYHAVHNVTVQVSDGTTQIDHVVVSKYGIFVVETKNYTGWIFGKERERNWNRNSNGRSDSFQNPIRQNHRHIAALSELLGVEQHLFHSVIAFCGQSEFKTPMPAHVLDGGYADYIRGKKIQLFSEAEAVALAEKLKAAMLERGEETDRKHVEYLQQRHANKEMRILDGPPIPDAAARRQAGRRRPRLSVVGREPVQAKQWRQANLSRHGKLVASLVLVAIVLFAANSFYGGMKQLGVMGTPSQAPEARPDVGPIDLPEVSQASHAIPSPAPATSDAMERMKKEKAWEHWYSPSPECENLTDRNMVECGNENIRARGRFERLYAEGKVR